jgi:hypothetical protein
MKRFILLCLIGVLIFVTGVFLKENEKEVTFDKNKNTNLVSGSEMDMESKRKKTLQTNGLNKPPFDLTTVETSLVRRDDMDGIVFTYEVRNTGEQDIELVYSTSQPYEYEIYKKTGELVYRFSDGKVFTQAIREKLLPAGKSLSITVSLPKLESGEYTLIIWIAAKGMGYFKEKQNFKVK